MAAKRMHAFYLKKIILKKEIILKKKIILKRVI